MTRRILFAVDDSVISKNMVEWACQKLLVAGDQVVVVHVIQLAQDDFAMDVGLEYANRKVRGRKKRKKKKQVS
jgi:nucleotide-binding universal stress UspA family protein